MRTYQFFNFIWILKLLSNSKLYKSPETEPNQAKLRPTNGRWDENARSSKCMRNMMMYFSVAGMATGNHFESLKIISHILMEDG